ncbi:MAG: hypothetical protein HQK73_13275 [Desulfamplus sp.]|nr:hypothetical protein [Desulfamplus sp.]
MFSISTSNPFQTGFAYAGENQGTWDYYKSRFISSDGRVADLFQNNISHSEGQGYGLLLSVINNDKATFENILNWTKNNIMVRTDGLAAWSWGQRDNGEWGVIDYNNATDGDILIAWALLKGNEKWQNNEWQSWADSTIDRIRLLLTIKKQNKIILLPGYYGFTSKSAKSEESKQSNNLDNINLRLNVSYFLFPAFSVFADSGLNDSNSKSGGSKNGDSKSRTAENKKFWQQLSGDSLTILKQSLSGSMTLPPDWLNIDEKGKPIIDKDKGAVFGYDAIRVPLYLAMAGDKKSLEIFKPYLKFCNKIGYVPVTVDLINEQIAIPEASAGFHAVLSKCASMVGETEISKSLMQKADSKIMQEKDDYYSNTLYLLAKSIQQ